MCENLKKFILLDPNNPRLIHTKDLKCGDIIISCHLGKYSHEYYNTPQIVVKLPELNSEGKWKVTTVHLHEWLVYKEDYIDLCEDELIKQYWIDMAEN